MFLPTTVKSAIIRRGRIVHNTSIHKYERPNFVNYLLVTRFSVSGVLMRAHMVRKHFGLPRAPECLLGDVSAALSCVNVMDCWCLAKPFIFFLLLSFTLRWLKNCCYCCYCCSIDTDVYRPHANVLISHDLQTCQAVQLYCVHICGVFCIVFHVCLSASVS